MRVMCFVFLVFQNVWKLCAGTNKSHKIRYKIRLVPRSFLCDNWIWIPSCTEIAQCPGVITTCSLPCVRQIRHFDGSNCRGHCVASVKWMGALKLPRPPVLLQIKMVVSGCPSSTSEEIGNRNYNIHLFISVYIYLQLFNNLSSSFRFEAPTSYVPFSTRGCRRFKKRNDQELYFFEVLTYLIFYYSSSTFFRGQHTFLQQIVVI